MADNDSASGKSGENLSAKKPVKTSAQIREDRLAEQLRANLRRRKQAVRKTNSLDKAQSPDKLGSPDEAD